MIRKDQTISSFTELLRPSGDHARAEPGPLTGGACVGPITDADASHDVKANEIYGDAKFFLAVMLANPPPPDHIMAELAAKRAA